MPNHRDQTQQDQTQHDHDAAMIASACRATVHLIKMRARLYGRRPMALDALYPGLSCATPEGLIAVAAHLVERERLSPRRWFGFGGEVNLVNAKAALLLGRVLRRSPPTLRHE